MHSARRTLLAGVVFAVVGLLMIASPWYLGVNAVSKTVVAFGIVSLLLGLSCVLHGAWDLLVRRRG